MRISTLVRFISGLAVLLLIYSCQNKPKITSEEVIAWIDQEPLLLEDFRSFYETDPNFGLDSTGLAALQDELDKFIDYHLAYQLGEKEGITQKPKFVRLKKWEEKQAILRALYRKKIESQITVSDSELYRMYQKINTEIHVRHLFTPDSNQAWQWYRSLQNGASFNDLARQAFRDSVLANNGGDLGWCKVSQLDEQFAQAALQLSPRTISPPVKTRWGYHVIQLLNMRKQINLGKAEFQQQRPKLEKLVKQEKSRSLARRFIASYLGEINPQPVKSTFWALWRACVPGKDKEINRLVQPRILDDYLIERVFETLPTKLDSPLIQYKNGTVSLKTFLTALQDIPLPNRPRFQTPRQLSFAIGKWIRDELLLQEALKENLSKRPEVKKEVAEILREQIYFFYLKQEFEQVNTPKEIEQYFSRQQQSKEQIPHLDRFQTLQDWKWHRAQLQLHRKLRKDFPSPIQINKELLKRENNVIDWRNRIPMFIFRLPS